MTIRRRLRTLAAVAGAVLFSGTGMAAAGEPWLPVSNFRDPTTIRELASGWILSDVDAGADPVLASPQTTSTVWARGIAADGTPGLRVGIDVPSGEGAINVRLRVSREQQREVRGTLLASERDVDLDGFTDLLEWGRRVELVGEPRTSDDLAARIAIRMPSWGVGASIAWVRAQVDPVSALFSFPNTSASLAATAESLQVYDLQSGALALDRSQSSVLRQSGQVLRTGLDAGFRGELIGLALGVALVQQRDRDQAQGTQRFQPAGGSLELAADRDLTQQRLGFAFAWRIDGKHDAGPGRFARWTLGARWQQPFSEKWSGSEVLTQLSNDGVAEVRDEWVRERSLLSQKANDVEVRGGVGVTDEGPLFRYGFGADARFSRAVATRRFRDNLTYRIDDPGAANERPASLLRAEGAGDWRAHSENWEAEYAISGGGRYAVTRYLGILLGSRVGYRHGRSDLVQALQSSTPIAGERTTQPNVIDVVELPYTSFEVVDEARQRFAGTFVDVRAGLAFHINRADITTAFALEDAKNTIVSVEGVWRW
ncbi:MAG: hypothetical protein D6761_04510 [Candidatus Dadabacteria bacterium]|nr:MAG: hypothetical protein D6761_04510 [Candidatus Dadabacteria bacterium]